MPNSCTQHYKLNQWSEDDLVQRADFNADNAKIDAAVKAVDRRVDGLSESKADASALNALSQTVSGKANASEVPRLEKLIAARADVVIGIYAGDGQTSRSIKLGFTPKALLVMDELGQVRHDGTLYGGLTVPGVSLHVNSVGLEIVEGGFNVAIGNRVNTNDSSHKYCYLAFR